MATLRVNKRPYVTSSDCFQVITVNEEMPDVTPSDINLGSLRELF
jgi:hypothetical protein